MARTPRPWYNAERGGWYVWRDGRKVPLAKGPRAETKKDAARAFHALMAATRKGVVEGVSLEALGEAFLDAVERDRRPLTLEFYCRHVRDFWGHAGAVAAAEVRPYHVTRWLDAHAWGPTTRHGAVTAVKRLYRWGRKQGLVETDPLADMEKPTPRRREEVMTPAQVDEILDATRDRAFRDLLAFLRQTGCRPSEAMAVEARHVDLECGVIAMESKTSGATGRERVIHLTPAAVALCRELIARWPGGPLLRNRDGNPWNRHATKSRFARLRAKLGLGREATLESFRHEFITDGLEAGVPIKTMAELVGHASTAMIDRHYSKLHRRHEHLRDAMGKVRPGDGKPT